MSHGSTHKTWDDAAHARQRARLRRQGTALLTGARKGAAPNEIKIGTDVQHGRIVRWFRSNWHELRIPPQHILAGLQKLSTYLPDETAALNKVIGARAEARQARLKKRAAARAARPKVDHAAIEKARKVNRTPARQAIVHAMTNNERNFWARAGYPADKATFEKLAASAIERLAERKKA
jgi:hypothetical protein